MVRVIDTIPPTTVTVPTFLSSKGLSINGKLDSSWLRKAGALGLMFAPVSYTAEAVLVAGAAQGIIFKTSGPYRSYEQQVVLFTSRYTPEVLAGRPRKYWQGRWWYQKPGTAMAATPGTSNHGLGIANDFAEEYDSDLMPDPIVDDGLIFLRDHPGFGFGLETRAEPWHWHWRHKNQLSQLVVDTLASANVDIPDLSYFGFTVPQPSNGEWSMVPRNERIYDSRMTGGKFAAGTSRRIKVPHPATQAIVKLVAIDCPIDGYFVVGGSVKPDTSACNYHGGIGQSLCYTGVDPDGTFQVWCEVGGAHLIVDLQGTG
jgi:hypothetical protein